MKDNLASPVRARKRKRELLHPVPCDRADLRHRLTPFENIAPSSARGSTRRLCGTCGVRFGRRRRFVRSSSKEPRRARRARFRLFSASVRSSRSSRGTGRLVTSESPDEVEGSEISRSSCEGFECRFREIDTSSTVRRVSRDFSRRSRTRERERKRLLTLRLSNKRIVQSPTHSRWPRSSWK